MSETDSQDPGGRKTPFTSKTIHFNWISSVMVPAIWPFLPANFRHQDYAINAVSAWFAIGNVVLRFFTSQALRLAKPKGNPDEKVV